MEITTYQANNQCLLIANSLTEAIQFSNVLQYKDRDKEDIVAKWTIKPDHRLSSI